MLRWPLAVVASLLALAICAATARAEPLSMTFTEARANVGVQLSAGDLADALLRAPATAPFDAQMDPAGSITAGAMTVPDFETFIVDPIDAFVTVEFDIGAISGTFDQATGALTLSGTAGGTLTSDGRSCTVSTTPAVLTLTTAGTTGGAAPLAGAPFTNGLAGTGAIAGQWDDMHAEPVTPADQSFCNNVEDRIGGPGGVWLEHGGDIVPPGRVAAGGFHSCAIKADDTPVCWGSLGDVCMTEPDETVVCWSKAVPAGLGTVDQLAAGHSHTCAIKTDDTPFCWGSDVYGQSTPPAGIGTVRQITAGDRHTCAVKTDRTPVCWGADDFGQSMPPAGIGTVKQISAAVYHTCAVETDGTPVCWGDDGFDQVTIPVGVGPVSQITAGETHTCAIETNGAPVCWGADDLDQTTVPAGIGTVKQITAGVYHTCAVKTDGAPVCWGRDAPIGPQPALPPGIGAVSEVAGGDWHSCAMKASGTVTCWGSPIFGQLGGARAISSAPPPSLVGVGPFSHQYVLAALGGGTQLPVRFFVSSGALPPGVTLDETTGELSGTPTADGSYTGVVSATNELFSPDAEQPFSITVDTTAPVAPSGLASTSASPSSNLKPRIAGAAEDDSTVRLYDNDTCTGLPRATGGAAAFASLGLQITVAAGSTTTVYAAATDAAGNTSACSTSKATYVHEEDPPTDPGTPTDAGTRTDAGTGDGGQLKPVPKHRACIVPKLAGKTLKKAKKALKAAGCKLGKVTKPKRAKGKKRRVLVVKSASPRRGARPADRKVDLELHPKPRKARR